MAADPSLPEKIGPYRILSTLGEGGMGAVYLGEQREPMRRRAAVKVIKLGMDTKAVLARFEAERQALAMMEHPNIAKVFEAGTTERGQPFFAMEHVAGTPITEFADQHRMPVETRLRLFQQVCEGVQHAHQKGIIHRDLKPSNVLVTEEGGTPRAKIIDFGLARATDHRLIEATFFTQAGQIVGTPEYMSPEQAGLGGLDVDTRSDVYSLGVLLYELLTGLLPFPSSQLRDAGLPEVQRVIREVDAPAPSARVSTMEGSAEGFAAVRGLDTRRLLSRLKGDLDQVVLKALRKDRSVRYASVSELAADIDRFLAGQPVLASPPTARYRLGKFLRRNRGKVTAASLVGVSLIAGGIASAVFALQAAHHLNQFNLLADIEEVSLLRKELPSLLPAHPNQRAGLDAWMKRAKAVVARRATLQEALDGIDGDSGSQRVLARALEQGLAELDEFATTPFAGLDLGRRERDWAHVVEQRTTVDFRNAWSEAIEAIEKSDGIVASRHYQGLKITPQMGLVPLGMDPDSQLWEFAHLRSAAGHQAPARNAAGRLVLDGRSGIVFVLVPGGTLRMGAQSSDPDAPSYDQWAQGREIPLHDVPLDPFFISKYEMTQGQWLRLTGTRPSLYAAETGDLSVPVERVSWQDATQLFERLGLRLPTEAQWEYSARGGSYRPWWTESGRVPTRLLNKVNIFDKSCLGLDWDNEKLWPEHDDGQPATCPVYHEWWPANPFGLHHVYGNVWEWCLDRQLPYSVPPQSGSGLRAREGQGIGRVARGAGFPNSIRFARASHRMQYDPDYRNDAVGVRPARALQRD